MPDLLTRETARKFLIRHMADYKTTERLILIAQAEALEWAGRLSMQLLSVRTFLLREAARLRKEAE